MRHLTRIGCEVPHRSVVFGCRLRASPAVGEVAVDELRVAAFPGHLLELFRAYELLVSGMACRGGCFMYLGVVPGVVYYRWPSSRAAFGFFHCRDVTKSYLQFFYFFFDQGGPGCCPPFFCLCRLTATLRLSGGLVPGIQPLSLGCLLPGGTISDIPPSLTGFTGLASSRSCLRNVSVFGILLRPVLPLFVPGILDEYGIDLLPLRR